MKSFLKYLFVAALAVVAAHVLPGLDLFSSTDGVIHAVVAFASFANMKNIDEQLANPSGIRRIGVIAVKDLLDTKVDWPIAVGATPDIDIATMEVTTPLPVIAAKTVAVITAADNSAFMSFENQGDRFYQSYKHSVGFDLAGLTKTQAAELRKFLNTGCIFFMEYNDGDIRVVGSKLSPIVLKQKGDTGKKGGDKRGYTLSGDNDNFVCEPPFYKSTLALPGMTIVA